MIQGIFYARFFPRQGPKIVAQSPDGCIVPSPTSAGKPPLVDFDVLQEYIIPRKPFCNRYVTVNDPDGRYAILGFPVLIPNAKYQRNEFIFNFGIIVSAEIADLIPYERVVRRLAFTFAEMEKQNEYLSQEGRETSSSSEGRVDGGEDGRMGQDGGGGGMIRGGSVPGAGGGALGRLGGGGGDGGAGVAGDGRRELTRRPIASLLEIIKEDLNLYGECMIPVDEANTINMKLFPHHTNPPIVKGWHVPVAKMKFADVVDPTWDLTLQKVIAHIDGVSDVRRIAWLADVSLDLATNALRHLLYYDTILLLDMFFFGACYAPRPAIHDFVANADGLVDECAAYVCITAPHHHPGGGRTDTTSTGTVATRGATAYSTAGGGGLGAAPRGDRVSHFQLIKLMTSFSQGKSVMEWLKAHQDAGFDPLRHLDVRRFVQFGVIKGLLYRVHKYVISKQYLASLATGQALPQPGGDPIQQYTDGCHAFDQIITEQNLADAEIMDRLKKLLVPPGDLIVMYR